MKYLGPSREPLNGFVPNSQGRCIWSLTRMSLKVEVKGQGHEGQKVAFVGPFDGLRVVYFGKISLAFS